MQINQAKSLITLSFDLIKIEDDPSMEMEIDSKIFHFISGDLKTAICHYCGIEVIFCSFNEQIRTNQDISNCCSFHHPHIFLGNQNSFEVRVVLPVVGKETCWEGDPILHLDKAHPEIANKVG